MKVILIMAVTIDGRIGRNSVHNSDWTSKEDKQFFVSETKKHGVVIMGSSTYNTIGRHLPKRLNLILTSEPEKYQDKVIPGELEFFKGTPHEALTHLEQKGFSTVVLAGGAKTDAAFLQANLVDEMYITIEPLIFGSGINFTEGIELDLKAELITLKKLNDNAVLLHYKLK